MSAITAAIRFLTVVPAPGGEWSARAARRSVAWFPAVGLGIGGAVAGVNWAARLAMPDLPAAALALAAGVVLTGALHLDGLADTFDGLFGGKTPKRRLEIMKDPSIGVYGVTAVVLVLVAKWAGLSSMPDLNGWAAIAVAVDGRASGCSGVDGRVPIREQRWPRHAVPRHRTDRVLGCGRVCGSPGVCSCRAVWTGRARVRHALVGLGVSAFRRAAKLGGGVTGDVYGASIELAEVSALLSFVAMFSAGLDIGPVWGG